MYDTIIRNALVIDGTGMGGKALEVGIADGAVVDIAERIPVKAKFVVDAKGLVLAPGFVDVQNHSDTYWNLVENPTLESLVLQGYTSILVGHCGSSLAPLLSREALKSSQKWHDLSGANSDWVSFAEYAKAIGKLDLGLNVGSLVGYSTLRRGLLGDEMRKLESRELDILLSALDQSLQEGALGLSSGQSYVHESAVSELEIFETAKIVKHYDGLLSIHLRSEGEQLLESLEEVLEIARRSEVRMKLSHFKVYHKKNWPLLKPALEMLENAVHQGVDIMYDAYPFTSIWQPLYTYLPDWAKLGGRVATLKRLQDPISRKKVLEGLKEHAGQLAGLVIASTSFPMHVTSKTLAKVAMSYDLSVEEALLKVLENGGVEILVFDDCLESNAVEELMRHPLGVVATDGGGFQYETSGQGRHKDKLVHPRCFGASAEFLQQVRVKNLISLEEAVSKLASEPARLAGLYNRGTIEVGKVADLVLFDPENVRNRATLTNPYVPPEGIASVWVNGQCVVADGKLLNVKPGNFLTKVKDD